MDETCVVHVFVSCHVVITRQDFYYLQGYSNDFYYFCKSNIRK